MEEHQRINGLVTDGLGAPVAGARIVISPWPPREATSDNAGAYLLEGVQRPADFARLMINATHSTCGTSLIREVPLGDARVDLQLLGSGSIDGVVEGLRGRRLSVLAQRPDEPVLARSEILGKAGDFRFEDVPAGDYLVSLKVPKSVVTSGVNITVVNGQTAIAKLVAVTSMVRLRVKVPVGRGRDLVLVPLGNGAETPEQPVPGIMRMHNMRSGAIIELVYFDYVLPGTYGVSVDGKTWTTIVVTLSPAEQTVEIAAEH